MSTATAPPRERWGMVHIDFLGSTPNTWDSVVRCEECDELLRPPTSRRKRWVHDRSGEEACPEVEP